MATYSNLNKNTGYTLHTSTISASSVSRVVRISFTGVEDSTLQTSFVIDDTSLIAS
ncbi:MAG TPA: hypothetical protein VGX49_07495 [Jatrophihabitans sp.]|nr:hypothetical protein [Jatrophihabitans sp.]